MNTPSIYNPQLLDEAKRAFENVKGSIVVAMQKLYEVKECGAWEDVSSSWSEYCEAELGISQSFASKLLSVNKHYLVDGGYSPENISNIPAESLYLAAKTGGTVEEQLERARTLKRSELKIERNEIEPHTPEYVEYCKICDVSRHNHN